MAAIVPFRGYRFNNQELKDHGGLLIAPPYDVLNHEDQELYLGRHPHNIVHLDWDRMLPEDKSHLTWHDRAATRLKKWIEEGILVQDSQSAIYVIETQWTHPITHEPMVRRGFICLLRLEEVTKYATIRLHEQTFSFHKEERLDLMQKTRAQLSPIFGFFPDPSSLVLESLKVFLNRTPDVAIKDPAGELHQVNLVTNPEEQKALVKALADNTVYIADGHHRYMTALNYRRQLREDCGEKGIKLPEGTSLDYVMIYLSPMSEKGLKVFPTHRILDCLDMTNDQILSKLEPFTDIKVFSFRQGGRNIALDSLRTKLAEDNRKGLTVFGLYLYGSDFLCFVKVKEKVKEALRDEAPEMASLSLLDVSVLTEVVFKRALGFTEELLDDPYCISYVSEAEKAIQLVDQEGKRAAFILNPTSLAEILKVTESGYVMPRKATYFYPKVETGLVVNLIDPMEKVG